MHTSHIKKISLLTLAFLLLLTACGAFVIHTLPVAWDAGACSGGFGTHIFEKFSSQLAKDYLDRKHDHDAITSVESIRSTENGVQWNDRTLFLSFDIQYEHKSRGGEGQ